MTGKIIAFHREKRATPPIREGWLSFIPRCRGQEAHLDV